MVRDALRFVRQDSKDVLDDFLGEFVIASSTPRRREHWPAEFLYDLAEGCFVARLGKLG